MISIMEPITPSQFRDMRVAAEALSRILTQNDIKFAFIGGFAVYLLGGGRSTLDIDVYVDMDINNIRERFKDVVCTEDSRFVVDGLKAFFVLGEGKERIPIETLALGSLGLPRTISVFYPDDGSIPVLVPGVLIVHLLHWLNIHDHKIGFSTYEGASPSRLYDAVGKMRNHWLNLGHDGNVQLLDDALNEEDALSVKCSAIQLDRN